MACENTAVELCECPCSLTAFAYSRSRSSSPSTLGPVRPFLGICFPFHRPRTALYCSCRVVLRVLNKKRRRCSPLGSRRLSLRPRLLGWDFSASTASTRSTRDARQPSVSPARGQNRCCKGAEASLDLSTAVRSGRKRAVAPRAALSSFCAGAAEAPPVTGGPARWLGRDTELAAAAVTGSCAAAAASAKVWTTMIDCPALHMC